MSQPNYDNLSQDQKEVFDLYKDNSSFEGQGCFADFLNANLAQGCNLKHQWEERVNHLDSIISDASSDEEVLLFRAMLDHYK